MANLNFPDATGDGQVWEAPTGVVYTYIGTPPNGYWSGTFGNSGIDQLNDLYVQVAGDNMTGNLSLGPADGASNIELNASSGQAVGYNYRVNANGNVQAGALASGEWFADSESADTDLVLGSGGSNIYFYNASSKQDSAIFYSNGTARFLYQTQSPNFRINTAAYVQAGAIGSGEWFAASAAADEDVVLASAGNDIHFFNASTNVDTHIFKSDGSADFAGNVYSSGSIQAAVGGSSANVTNASVEGVRISNGGTITATVTGDTNLAFRTLTKGDTGLTSLIRGDGSASFSKGNASISSDGSASFAGGSIALNTSQPTFAINSQFVIANKSDGNNTVASISNTGSAEFAGTVTSGSATAPSTIGFLPITDSNTTGTASVYATNVNTGIDAFVFIGAKNTGATSLIRNSGAAEFAGTVAAQGSVLTSDARFKTNVQPAKPQLADVVALGNRLKTWDWTENAPVSDKDTRFLGLIAQELEEICPTLVTPISRTKTLEITPPVLGPKGAVLKEAVTQDVDDSYKGIKNDVLIMKLLGAVAELSAEVEELKSQLNK